MKRFVISAEARNDLDEIGDYIAARSSPETTSAFLWRLHDTFASVAQSPSAGVVAAELERDSVRKFAMGNYLIYYRPMRGKVLIWRVLHGRRLQLRALRKRDKS